uniref:Uncharacterized protein n=1 Tax=Timema monikensis TaxID=170555 RepID=A0A7R9EBP1_9NEOP|nr:unnamed protein product [Timema monikensis]
MVSQVSYETSAVDHAATKAGAEDTEKQSTVKKSSHLTESSKTTTTTTTTSSQQTFRPVNLANIPLPTTGGHVTGMSTMWNIQGIPTFHFQT